VSRSPRGPYRPLRDFIEFRMPAQETGEDPTRRFPGRLVFAGFMVLILLLLLLLWWLLPNNPAL
jgi:hypothetical protein